MSPLQFGRRIRSSTRVWVLEWDSTSRWTPCGPLPSRVRLRSRVARILGPMNKHGTRRLPPGTPGPVAARRPRAWGQTYGERRRVPGLRREELGRSRASSPAVLHPPGAGPSPRNASPEVLDAIAGALQLRRFERAICTPWPAPKRGRRAGRPPAERSPRRPSPCWRPSGADRDRHGPPHRVLAWNRQGHALSRPSRSGQPRRPRQTAPPTPRPYRPQPAARTPERRPTADSGRAADPNAPVLSTDFAGHGALEAERSGSSFGIKR